MRILVLCEGNADSWGCWSGTARSIVDQLRLDGHTVDVGDVDLSGVDRWAAAAATISFPRRRWGTRYHLGAVPFELRSRRAAAHIAARRGRIDAILQIGATFRPAGRANVPYFLCCDSNIRVAQRGASSGYSDASALAHDDVKAIARREHAVYAGAAGILTLSEQLRQSFVDDFEIPPHRVRATYAGPNLDLSRVPASMPRRGDRPPTVLFVGLQFHRKGGDLLVESFRRVRNRVPAARLLMAGVPQGQVQEPGVECLGELDKRTDEGWVALVAAYASADVFALPTRFEPFGVAFVEAMHFGVPCVGPNAWAVPEIVADGETGFTVPPGDVDALTDRLVRLLTDPALARTMGDAARARARALFTWPHVVGRMVDAMTAAA